MTGSRAANFHHSRRTTGYRLGWLFVFVAVTDALSNIVAYRFWPFAPLFVVVSPAAAAIAAFRPPWGWHALVVVLLPLIILGNVWVVSYSPDMATLLLRVVPGPLWWAYFYRRRAMFSAKRAASATIGADASQERPTPEGARAPEIPKLPDLPPGMVQRAPDTRVADELLSLGPLIFERRIDLGMLAYSLAGAVLCSLLLRAQGGRWWAEGSFVALFPVIVGLALSAGQLLWTLRWLFCHHTVILTQAGLQDYRKRSVGTEQRVTITWDRLTAMETRSVREALERGSMGTPTRACSSAKARHLTTSPSRWAIPAR